MRHLTQRWEFRATAQAQDGSSPLEPELSEGFLVVRQLEHPLKSRVFPFCHLNPQSWRIGNESIVHLAEGRYRFGSREAEIFSITKWHYERFTALLTI
jgi:hypothetical protein